MFRRPRQALIALGIAVLVLAGTAPFLWAGYHWFAGQAALKRYHSAEALQHFNACLAVWPWSRSVQVHLLACRAARREGLFPEALDRLYEAQSTLGDQSPETLLEWALLHAGMGDMEKVESHLQDQLRNNSPHALLILEALTEGYARLSRISDALNSVDEWLARDPDNAQALYLRSSIYRHNGAWGKAAPDLRRAVELDPELPGARWWLAVALVNVGYYDDALRHLEVLRRHPPKEVDRIDIQVQLAICRHRMGRGPEARELLDAVLAERPDNGLALLTRGQIEQMNGQLPQAEKWMRQAAQVLPYDYKTHWALRECLRQQGKKEEAEAEEAYANQLRDRLSRFGEISTRLLSLRPNDPALYCEAAKLLQQLGNPEGSKNWLFSALLVDRNYVPAWTALADYCEKQGDTETAEEYRRQAQQSAELQTHARNPDPVNEASAKRR